ncbi:MAG: DegT/DnrJ/EryC1/StrS family aminotransferase [Promethearchaeota archaeon]
MFNDLSKQWETIKEVVLLRFDELFKKSDFINGQAIEEFEKNFADYCGTKYGVGVSNGTDALKISLAAMKLESPCGVIIPANTFIATALAITYLSNLKYDLQLIDCDEYYQIDVNLLEACLKKKRNKWKSCVIIPVHLFGHPANIEIILELGNRYNCLILEDASQAHGAMILNKKVGGFGNISAFSLYPGKNLGAAGDAGVITTNDEKIYDEAKALRNYCSRKKYYYDGFGWNNRMDTIQAIIVDEKLKYLDDWNDKRIEIAVKYNNLLDENNIISPKTASYANKNVYHIYAVRIKDGETNRDKFQKYLSENNIPTGIHYPIPIEKTTPFKYLEHFNNKNTRKYAKEMISLPMHPFLTDDEINYIIETINNYFK